MNTKTDTRRLVTLAIFTALIIVLQLLSNVLKVGTVSITLSLVPIVVGSALYGSKAGAYLGAVLGVVVTLCCMTGLDAGGAMVWAANPFLCALVCIGKTTVAGAIAGGVYRLISKKSPLAGAVTAGILCPVVNTGIFILGMALFFKETLNLWAGGTDVVYYALIGLTGINFVVELLINLILASVIVRIINARAK